MNSILFRLCGFISALLLTGLTACGGGGGGDGGGDAGGSPSPLPTLGTLQLIETNESPAFDPQISVAPNGNAIVVWRDFDHVWSNRFVPGIGWGTPSVIDNGIAVTRWDPQIALDSKGNAIAVWEEDTGGFGTPQRRQSHVWANRYTAGSGWRTPILIFGRTTSSSDPKAAQISIAPNGDAVVVWDRLISRYVISTDTWETPQLIDLSTPRVAFGPDGNAIAVGTRGDSAHPGQSRIYAKRYNGSTNTWGSPQLIQTTAGNGGDPQIAVDARGNAVVVWEQLWSGDPIVERVHVHANRYDADTGTWEDAQVITGGAALAPRVAVDANGNAMAVWQRSVPPECLFCTRSSNLLATRYIAGVGWQGELFVETDDNFNALGARVAIGSNGQVIVVWQQAGIRANRYTVNTGWGSPVRLDNNVGRATVPQIAIDSADNVIAVWQQDDDEPFGYNIHANRFRW